MSLAARADYAALPAMWLTRALRAPVALLCFACAAKPSAVGLGGTASALDEKDKDKRAQPQAASAAESSATAASSSAPSPSSASSAPPVGSAAPVAPLAAAKVGDGYQRTLVLGAELHVTLELPDRPLSLDVTGTIRQEVRFKVTRIEHGRVAGLSLVYGACRVDTATPGRPPFAEELSTQGKSYDVEIAGDDIKASTSSRTTLSDDELEDTRSDVRSYLRLDDWLHPAQPKGADSQATSSLLPTSGQHFKITDERMTFRAFEPLGRDAQKAVYDVHLTIEGGDRGILATSTLDGTAQFGASPLWPLAVHATGPLTVSVSGKAVPVNGSGKLDLDITFTR